MNSELNTQGASMAPRTPAGEEILANSGTAEKPAPGKRETASEEIAELQAEVERLTALLHAKPEVPADVMRALDRMCTPLHESHLKGATAKADAHCMKIIRDYVLAASEARDVGVSHWRPIDTAPRHTEVMVWRADSGPFIAKLTNPDVVITPEEMERENLEFPADFEEWYSDAYGWQEGSEKPTHWMPLPDGPDALATRASEAAPEYPGETFVLNMAREHGVDASRISTVNSFAQALWRLAAQGVPEEDPSCNTCGGRVEIGGFINAESGYQSDPCPDCGEAAPVAPDESHTDDMAIDTFAPVMKNKMEVSRAKGRGGWETTNPAELSRMLREHVEKGDPTDVANFCMMLWHLDAAISPSQAAPEAQPASEMVAVRDARALPSAVHAFLTECAGFHGEMVKGNWLSAEAAKLIASQAVPDGSATLYTLDEARALLIPEGHTVARYITGKEMAKFRWKETELGVRGDGVQVKGDRS